MKRSIATDLALLNAARARLNMAHLKSWKESHAKLKAQIDKINKRIRTECVTILPITDPRLIREEKRRTAINAVAERILAGEADARPEREPIVKGPPPRTYTPRPRVTIPNTVTLADLARSLGLSPKIARAKMRKRKIDFEVAQYVYPQDRAGDVITILRHKG
jgi:hypothetical protein